MILFFINEKYEIDVFMHIFYRIDELLNYLPFFEGAG